MELDGYLYQEKQLKAGKLKMVHKGCKKDPPAEVIEISRPSEEHPTTYQYICLICDPGRQRIFGKEEVEVVEKKGATAEDRIDIMRKEVEEEEKITYISRDKPKIKPPWSGGEEE